MGKVTIVPVGDSALHVTFEEKINRKVNEQVHQLKAVLTHANISGIQEMIPAFKTLTVLYDPMIISYEDIKACILTHMSTLFEKVSLSRKIHILPVCYEEPFNVDLKDLSDFSHLSIEEIIKRHTSKPYYIYMLGFLPGFPYLGGMDESLAMPRLSEPRMKVEAGSVGIAESQTGVYTLDSPGGWRIIGKTPVHLVDLSHEQIVPYQAGEWIQFQSISKQEFLSIEKEVKSGTYQWKTRREEGEDDS